MPLRSKSVRLNTSPGFHVKLDETLKDLCNATYIYSQILNVLGSPPVAAVPHSAEMFFWSESTTSKGCATTVALTASRASNAKGAEQAEAAVS